MKNFFEYPKIQHFKEACSNAYRESMKQGEKLTFNMHGTVKLHGTNFAVVYDKVNEEIYFQKRTGIIQDDDPFFGYKEVFTEHIIDHLKYFFYLLENDTNNNERYIILYGELIGDTIQRKVALENLPRQFCIFELAYGNQNGIIYFENHFNLKIKYNYFISQVEETEYHIEKIQCIENYKTWDLTLNVHDKGELLDFQNKVAQITLDVEKQCPFALANGVDGTGEGVVWKCGNFRFKVKGDEHTNSKVRTLNPVDQEKVAKAKELQEIVDIICTDARLKQGFQYLIENNISKENSKEVYLKWVVSDTLLEEKDYLIEKEIDEEKVKGALYRKALNYFNINKGE